MIFKVLRSWRRALKAHITGMWYGSRLLGRTRGQQRLVRPAAEEMEPRVVLSTYVYLANGTVSPGCWSDVTNFGNATGQRYGAGQRLPGSDPTDPDTVIFDSRAGNNNPSIVDRAFTISRLQVDTSWSGSINILAGVNLTLSGDSSIGGTGAIGGAGNLTISGGTTSWYNAAMNGTGTTTVASGATLVPENAAADWRTISIAMGGTLRVEDTLTLDAATVTNNGTVTWNQGTIALAAGAQVNNASSFTIANGGMTMTGDGDADNAFNNTGNGSVTLNGARDSTTAI